MSIERGQENIVARAIIVIDGKVLLGKRASGIGKNQFALIGGNPKKGETPEHTIEREVNEEIGLKFKNPIIFIEEYDDKTIPGQTWHAYYFLGETEGKINLKRNEVSKIIYITKENLSQIDIAFDHKKILTQFFSEARQIK